MTINDVLSDALYLDIDYPQQTPIIQIQGKTVATEQNFINISKELNNTSLNRICYGS